MDQVNCSQHGRQGIGLVCTHIAHALGTGRSVGFFWGPETDTARPDAWCWDCEQAFVAIPASESADDWFRRCDFKVFCAACWDEAKKVMYDDLVPKTGR